MTKAGARILIESLSMRVFDIDDTITRLQKEKEAAQVRIMQLEAIPEDSIVGHRVIPVK